MAGRGRPPLRIGQRGKIVREYLGGGVWLARARFRDSDGVTRRVQRVGPMFSRKVELRANRSAAEPGAARSAS